MANIKRTVYIEEDLLHMVKWVVAGTGRTLPEFLNVALRRQIEEEEEDTRQWRNPATKKVAVLIPGQPYPDPPGEEVDLKKGRPSEVGS